MKVVVTGGAGLVGSHCCELYAKRGAQVISVDNNMRGTLFGDSGSIRDNAEVLVKNYPNIEMHEVDVRRPEIRELVSGADLIIHAAAQPSHPKSIFIPEEDFMINAWGTLNLLEAARAKAEDAVFIHCSTNKVYGENPNTLPIVEKETRYDYDGIEGVDESLSLDHTMHTPFGVSKVAADLYTQEYARLYGLKTGIFRMGCITGPRSKAVEMHNWIPYFFRVNLEEKVLNIYGFKGKQVRDIIDARDLTLAFDKFSQSPWAGEAYNIGGGQKNSISILESFERIEKLTGKP
ncbi:MAG: NAD-dependent epimerase/dehydratase family protein, partial [Nitrososphaerales archaeon]